MLKRVLIMLMGLLLLGSMTLVAQERIGKSIVIDFVNLNYNNTYEELNEFLIDYNHCDLRIMYWIWHLSAEVHRGYFFYNSTLIEEEQLFYQLQNDDRVENAFPENAPPRQFGIILQDDVDEAELILDYAEYGLTGSSTISDPGVFFYHWGIKLFAFNDKTIYTGTLYDLLRADARIASVDCILSWSDGCILVYVEENIIIDSLIEDYHMINFTQYYDLTWYARFNYYENDEFFILQQLTIDQRIREAELFFKFDPTMDLYCVRPQKPPVSIHDQSEIPKLNFTIYPNPVMSSDVVLSIQTTNTSASKPSYKPEVHIYNIKGQLVKRDLITNNTYTWNRRNQDYQQVSTGIYLVRIKTENETLTKKIILLK